MSNRAAVRWQMFLAMILELAGFVAKNPNGKTATVSGKRFLVAGNPVNNGKKWLGNMAFIFAIVIGGLLVGDARADALNATVATSPSPFAVAINPATNTVYAVDATTTGYVSAINGATHSVSNIRVGSTPKSIAMDVANNSIYVANYKSNSVSVINGSTNLVTKTITSIGDLPEAIAVNSKTNKIYVLNQGDGGVQNEDGSFTNDGTNSVEVVDGANNSKIVSIPVGISPSSLAVDTVRNIIYVANYSDNTVSIIDGNSNLVTATIDVGEGPLAVAVNSVTNTIYVANQNDQTVTVINGTNYSTTFISIGVEPSAIAVNLVTDLIYVANQGDNTLSVINGGTNSVSTVSVTQYPEAVAVNSVTNKVYVIGSGSAIITVVDGVSNSTASVSMGGNAVAENADDGVPPSQALAINALTNMVYAAIVPTDVVIIAGSPDAPILASPSNGSPNLPVSSLNLNWGTSAGIATSYEVEVSASSTFGTTIFDQTGSLLTSATVSVLLANSQTYYWRANASNAGGPAWSQGWSFTTAAVPGVPAIALPAPTNNAVNQPINGVTLSWASSGSAPVTSYSVQLSTSPSFSTTINSWTDPLSATTTSEPLATLTNNTTYYWMVSSTGPGGTSNWTGVSSFTTIIATPTIASPSTGSSAQSLNPVLTWNSVAGATNYAVQISTSVGFGSTVYAGWGAGLTTTSTTVPLGVLNNGTIYYWRAGAKNSGITGDISGWSAPWSFATAILPPATPTVASGATGQSVTPSLGWSASVGQGVTYTVVVSTDGSRFTNPVQGTIKGLTWTPNAALTAGTIYYWEVEANGPLSENSGYSGPWSFTTLPKPAQVTLVSPTPNDSGFDGNDPKNVILTWDTSSAASTYLVQVSTSASFAFGSTVYNQGGIPQPTTGTTVQSSVVSGLTNGIEYYWRVGAKDINGVSKWSAPSSFATTVLPPATPTVANGANSQSVTPSLGWSASAGQAVTYSVVVSTDGSGFTNPVQGTITGLTWTPNAALTNGTTYSWEVQAIGPLGETSVYSGPWSFATLAIPTLASPANNSSGVQVNTDTLRWNAVTAATSYAVQISTDLNFGSTVFSQYGLSVPFATATGLSGQKTYYWRAGAKNSGTGGGVSGWSSVWTFSTPHFIVKYNTGSNMTVYVLPVKTNGDSSIISIDDSTLSTAGDEIGAFNAAGLCVGGAKWTGANTYITVWGNPTQYKGSSITPDEYGIDANEVIQYRIWRSSSNPSVGREEAATPVYGDSDGVHILEASQSYKTGNIEALTSLTGVSTPTLSSPVKGVNQLTINPILDWSTIVAAPTNGASSYAVQVSTASDFGSTVFMEAGLSNAQAKVNSGLTNNISYFWRANASVGNSASWWSGTWSFTTIGQPSLIAPTLYSTNVSISPLLSWSTLQGAVTYKVDVSSTGNFSTTVFSVAGLSGLTQQLTGLADSQGYIWRVGSINASGISGWSGTWSFKTIGQPSLVAPTPDSTNVSISPVLSWSTLTGAVTYQVDVSSSSNFSTTVFSAAGLAGLSQQVKHLANNQGYIWRVEAMNASGISGWSNVWSFTTIGGLTLYTPIEGPNAQQLTPSLTWSTVSGAISYAVQVSTDESFGSTAFSQIGITSGSSSVSAIVSSGLMNYTTYYWRAGAKNSTGGVSGWTTAWTFKTVVAAPTVTYPAHNAINIPLNLTLDWNSTPGASSYVMQLSTSISFGTIIDAITQGTTTRIETGLSNTMKYYWRLQASNNSDAIGTSGWNVDSFTTITGMTIQCTAGWNMISLNIRPVDSTFAAVFPDPTDEFILVKNVYGEAYIPSLGITPPGTTLQTGQGYQLYTAQPYTITTQGSLPSTTQTISLSPAWNLIAYLQQANLPIATELESISNQIVLVKNNEGDVYAPYFGIDGIGTMQVGQGYYVAMPLTQTGTINFTYPSMSSVAKRHAGSPSLLALPSPRHYGHHVNTGNNATVMATKVTIGTSLAPDSCEIGAYNEQGHLVGSGMVVHGLAAFAVWGANSQTGQNDGCGNSEKITFKLWNGKQEYPLTFTSSNGTEGRYVTQGIFLGRLEVPEGALITRFDLGKVYPNPIKGLVKVEFDVPAIAGASEQYVEINVFDMKGSLVHQVAKGKYQPGHYLVTWNTESDRDVVGSSVYVIQMKGHDFEKRMKLVRIK